MRSLLALALLGLVACGKSDPQLQPGPFTSLDSFAVRFEPDTRSILVTGMLKATQTTGTSITGEGEFFYLTGKIPGSEPLKSVVGEASAAVSCLNPECSQFSIPLKLSRLSLEEPIKVTLWIPKSVRALPDAVGGYSAPPFSDVWKELLDHGVVAAHSSLALTEWRDLRFLSAYARGKGPSKTRWLLASSKEGEEKLETNYVYEPEAGPLFTLATEPGRIERLAPGEWALDYAGGKLLFQIANP